jgi:serine/threonine protein phosphatase PrpC
MRISGRGEYYKNVRQEWATLVCTPPSAKFQDALAFTRSLGDFHLQTYGVSHVPEVCCVDLHDMFRDAKCDDEPLVILLASDGVWDNWRLGDSIKEVQAIRQSVLDSSAPGSYSSDSSSEQTCKRFMKKNLSLGLHNFGRQADNMTAITCIVTKPQEARKRAVTGDGMLMR